MEPEKPSTNTKNSNELLANLTSKHPPTKQMLSNI